MPDDRDHTEDLPPATEDIGLPTPPSPGRLPPIDLPPAQETEDEPASEGGGPTKDDEP